MRAVSDTSPVFNLAAIGQIQLLHAQFAEVLIPGAVHDELTAARHPAIQEVRRALDEGWLKPLAVREQNLVRALRQELDGGEAEAIALALELGTSRVLIDERDGREVARQMGLEPIGVLGILLRARKLGQLDSVKAAMLDLQRLSGFYIDSRLFKEVVQSAGE